MTREIVLIAVGLLLTILGLIPWFVGMFLIACCCIALIVERRTRRLDS